MPSEIQLSTHNETNNPVITNALSVDVEEYYHALIFQEGTKGAIGFNHLSRVEGSVDRVLDLLGRRNIRATFFVLGEVAAHHPTIVKKIAAGSHEVACHGYRHELVCKRSSEAFRADLQAAKLVLEDLTGKPVIGYRAPNYSIGRDQSWAYDILLEEGFRYDSSVYPILHDRYGDHKAPRFPYVVRRNGQQSLVEFPVGTARVLGANLPIGGGGFFRLFPEKWLRRGIQHVNAHEGQPIMFYFHPWELDADQPRAAMPWHHYFRHYVNLHRMESKLQSLLGEISFAPAREVLSKLLDSN